MNHPRSILRVLLLFLLLSSRPLLADEAALHFPGKTWDRVADPASEGWSVEKLQAAEAFSETNDTAAVVVVSEGRIVADWGASAQRLNVHSIRKSFLSTLYGIAVENKQIDTSKTLADLGVDDLPPALSADEKQARVVDLLKARSGVYHPAAYETEAMKARRPQRGSHAHDTFWYYNNWDFNALGTIYESAAKRTVFEGFKQQIAAPLEMEDYRLADTRHVRENSSQHAAYEFRMTARDMARFGLLFCRGGKWGDRQIIPAAWISESTKSYSNAGPSGGYGYMWWIAARGKHLPHVDLPDGSFSARGHRGHYIVVVPKWDLVVVHRVDTDARGTEVDRNDFGKLLGMILEARPKS
jgi:CubicO group peptidase (beta-lactamase class C family)